MVGRPASCARAREPRQQWAGHMVAGMGIFARWAGPKGRLPDDLRSQLAVEGILVIEDGVPATIIFCHYRGPGRRGNWQGNYLLAFAMTERRLLVYGATPDRRPPSLFVNVSWDQARAGGLRALLDDGSLRLCFDIYALYLHSAAQAAGGHPTAPASAPLAGAAAKLSGRAHRPAEPFPQRTPLSPRSPYP